MSARSSWAVVIPRSAISVLTAPGSMTTTLMAELCDLTPQGVTGGLQGELRTGVRAIRRQDHLPANGTDVHHGARADQQRRQQRLDNRDVAEHIDLELPAPLRYRQRFDWRVDRDSGVVDQRAQRTTLRIAPDTVGDRGHIGFHGDVEEVRLDAVGAQRVGIHLAAYSG